jgi:tetratricopeptide (TPR) repeat protein
MATVEGMTSPCVLAMAVLMGASSAPKAGVAGASAGIPWETSFKSAMKKARAEGRPLLVDFWAEWCHWCHELDATTYRDPAVVASAAAFVPVKVNTEGSLGDKQISTDYGIEILPTMAFLSPRGHVVLLREQFETPRDFVKTLEAARTAAAEVGGWEEALARDGDDAVALAGLGAHLVSQKQLDEGRAMLERAVKHDASRPAGERKRTRMTLADVQARAERFRDSARLLESALAIEPASAAQDAEALFRLGETYQRLGEIEHARGAWTKAVATAADGPIAVQARQALASLPN